MSSYTIYATLISITFACWVSTEKDERFTKNFNTAMLYVKLFVLIGLFLGDSTIILTRFLMDLLQAYVNYAYTDKPFSWKALLGFCGVHVTLVIWSFTGLGSTVSSVMRMMYILEYMSESRLLCQSLTSWSHVGYYGWYMYYYGAKSDPLFLYRLGIANPYLPVAYLTLTDKWVEQTAKDYQVVEEWTPNQFAFRLLFEDWISESKLQAWISAAKVVIEKEFLKYEQEQEEKGELKELNNHFYHLLETLKKMQGTMFIFSISEIEKGVFELTKERIRNTSDRDHQLFLQNYYVTSRSHVSLKTLTQDSEEVEVEEEEKSPQNRPRSEVVDEEEGTSATKFPPSEVSPEEESASVL